MFLCTVHAQEVALLEAVLYSSSAKQMRAGSLQTSPSVCHNAPGSCCLASTGCAPIAAGLACCILYSQHTADLVLAKHLSYCLISLNPTKTSLSLKARSETDCGPTVIPKAKPNSP